MVKITISSATTTFPLSPVIQTYSFWIMTPNVSTPFLILQIVSTYTGSPVTLLLELDSTFMLYTHLPFTTTAISSLIKIINSKNTSLPVYACCSKNFWPFGPKSLAFIKELESRIHQETGEETATSYLKQHLSMAIQRGNQAAVLGSLGPATSYSINRQWFEMVIGILPCVVISSKLSCTMISSEGCKNKPHL